MLKIKNMKEMFNYLDSINDTNDMRYDDCKGHSFINIDSYKDILKEVLNLEEKPKRIIDIGSNMNQYAYMFENEDIDYVGIDLWNSARMYKPYESEHTKFIGARYEDIADWFKDDVIISNLCVNYLVNRKDVKAKHLITNELDNGVFKAKVWW